MYEVRIDDDPPTMASADLLMDAWGEVVPQAVADALALSVNGQCRLMDLPKVVVRRIR